MPHSAAVLIIQAPNVIGILRQMPPMSFFMSKLWWLAVWLTEPAHRNRQHLKKAWVKMWNTAAGPRADAETHHHVAELRHGRVGEHLLDVVLHERQQRRDQDR